MFFHAASAMRSSKQEELEALYSSIPRIAAEGLTNYEKSVYTQAMT